jgi:hypothetical protein
MSAVCGSAQYRAFLEGKHMNDKAFNGMLAVMITALILIVGAAVTGMTMFALALVQWLGA